MGFRISLKVLEMEQGGSCHCTECEEELASGNRAIVAFYNGAWYIVLKATCCEVCDDGTWVPVLCTVDTAERVAKRTAEEMELDFNQFFFEPYPCESTSLHN